MFTQTVKLQTSPNFFVSTKTHTHQSMARLQLLAHTFTHQNIKCNFHFLRLVSRSAKRLQKRGKKEKLNKGAKCRYAKSMQNTN